MARPFARRRKKFRPVIVGKRGNKTRVSFAGAGNLIKDHWDNLKTVRQNYERLGLTSSLKGYSGIPFNTSKSSDSKTGTAIHFRSIDDGDLDQIPGEDTILNPEIKIPEVSKLIGTRISGVKGDKLKDLNQKTATTEYLDFLSKEIKKIEQGDKVVRHSSLLEAQILHKLIQKHKLNYIEMAKDVKINTYQLTPGALKRKIKRLIPQT